MEIKSLRLENFRNYETLSLSFAGAGTPTSIIGQNAQGKTNILEAIYLLALTRSFRTSCQPDLIQWGSDFARVTGRLETMEGEKDLEVFIGNPPQPKRSLKKNGVKTSTYDFVGNCRIVFFHPEDLNILYLGPDLRRKYLDILNIQLSPRYYRALRSYKRILEQRNSLLRNIRDGIAAVGDLKIWDEQLVAEGAVIMSERQKTVEFINRNVSRVYSRISGNAGDKVEVAYNSFFDSAGDLSEQNILDGFAERLKLAQNKDLQALVTSVGPHRDDIFFELNGRRIAMHASRGEYRSLLLALKLIELEYFEAASGEKPILLLDDVFSELDAERQKALMQGIEGCQTILTATHQDGVHGVKITCGTGVCA